MLEVQSMPSQNADVLKCESYTTTPRSVRTEGALISKIDIKHVEEDFEKVTGNVTRREGAQSAPTHFSEHLAQSLTERLVDDSEQCSLDDSLIFESAVADDWNEATTGWKVVVPYPKYVTNNTVTRSKPERKDATRKSVRCVDEDLAADGYYTLSWKGNVEPVTYRYIPNNGYYRNNKTGKRDATTLRKSRSERSLLTPEMRQAQKTLKRDLENQFKTDSVEEQQAGSVAENPGTLHVLYRDQDLGAAGGPQNTAARVLYRSQAAAMKAAEEERDCDVNDGQINAGQVNADMTHALSKRLPIQEQKFIRTVSDLFMENFNARLSAALEKEAQASQAPLKKTADSSSTSMHSTTAGQVHKKGKDGRWSDSTRPTIQAQKEHGKDFSDDLFTVVPVKRELPLRPLEKLTPKHKQMLEKDVSSLDHTPSPDLGAGEGEGEDDGLVIMLGAAASQPSVPKSATSSGLSSIHSALAMTNCDIEKMRNVPLRNDYQMSVSMPKPFYVHKGSAASSSQSQRKGAMRYSVRNMDRQAQDQVTAHDNAVYDGASTKTECSAAKDLAPVGTMLPEIMGKRLTVTTTTHRML